MRARRAAIAPNDSQDRFESLGVDVFRGEAKFVSPHELELDGRRLCATNFVIATGTRPAIPPIEGIDHASYFTNESIFDELKTRPQSLVVLGGGPIGCELGQAFARLGVEVTILNRGARLLSKEDADVAAFIQERFEQEGIAVLNGTEVKSCARRGAQLEISYSQESTAKLQRISGSALLIASGRTPNIEQLDLRTAGVRFSKRGIETNERLQTSQPHIYAAGDVVGPFQFTHMADYHARIVVRNILMPFSFLRQKTDYSAVPWCTFLDPEVARVGLSEAEAKKKGIEYDLVRQEFATVDRAVVESQEFGFAKILVKRHSDRILGAAIVGDHAGELIHEFVLAMKQNIGLGKIAAMIHVYPTLSEVARKAGDQYNKRRLTPLARKISGWLYERRRL
jgi:pyruvate/2-oxoglutarate dehydrogenase complex dihydrolipoamide dehydrogenase (E3) component